VQRRREGIISGDELQRAVRFLTAPPLSLVFAARGPMTWTTTRTQVGRSPWPGWSARSAALPWAGLCPTCPA